jgi:hypothetical protein
MDFAREGASAHEVDAVIQVVQQFLQSQADPVPCFARETLPAVVQRNLPDNEGIRDMKPQSIGKCSNSAAMRSVKIAVRSGSLSILDGR